MNTALLFVIKNIKNMKNIIFIDILLKMCYYYKQEVIHMKAKEIHQMSVNDIITFKKPTAQARMLGLELMEDGNPHNRQEIIEYIKSRGKELGLEEFSQGCISGGIQDIVSMTNCEKLGTGTYKFSTGVNLNKDIPLLKQASDTVENAILSIQRTARKIDYITATEKELNDLNTLKFCVNELENILNILNKKSQK